MSSPIRYYAFLESYLVSYSADSGWDFLKKNPNYIVGINDVYFPIMKT